MPRDFNINRLERYLTICNSSKVSPINVLNKIDLINEQQLSEILENIKARWIKNVPVIAISNESHDGYDEIKTILEKGEIDKASYENYLKLEREKAHFESTAEERRKKDKEFGKFMKNYKKDMKKNKF